jgi:hypothetical protein
MFYRIQEGRMTLAGEWRDQSVNVLVPAEVSVKGANLVVARDTLPPNISFSDYVAGQRQTFERQLADFTLLRDVAGVIDERPAHFLEFTWTSQGKPLHQMIMVVHHKVGLLNFTASIPGTPDAATRQLLLQAIRSFKFAAAGTEPE